MGTHDTEQVVDAVGFPGMVDGWVCRAIGQEAYQGKDNHEKKYDSDYFFTHAYLLGCRLGPAAAMKPLVRI